MFSDAISCDSMQHFHLLACRHTRAGGVLFNFKMPHPSLKKTLHTSPHQESPVVILIRLQREQGAVCCPLELCEHLWVLPSSKGERWGKGGGGRTQVLCRAPVCTAVQRDPWIYHAAILPATQPSSQKAWFPPIAGIGLLAPPAPLSPLPQLAGSLCSRRSLQDWQTSPRWPPCSRAGFALTSLLHHSSVFRAVVLPLVVLWHFCCENTVRETWEC